MLDSSIDIENDKLVFLNSFIDANNTEIFLKMYNTVDKKLYLIKDFSGFKPYFYMKKDEVDEIILQKFLDKNKGMFEIQLIELYDGIQDKQIEVYKFIANNVYNAYKKWNIDLGVKYQYEYLIKFYESYCLDKQIVPCGLYYIKNGMLYEQPTELLENPKKTLQRMVTNSNKESEMYQKYLVDNTVLLSQEVPDIPRCAIDIEVAGLENQIPDVAKAEYSIVMVSFYNNEGRGYVIGLESYFQNKGLNEKYLDDDLTITTFVNEESLIYHIFAMLDKYPIILTYNGDDFDLPYISQRSKILNMDQSMNPIIFSADNLEKKNSFRKDPCLLKKSIHLDLYRLFSNKALHNYGFNRKYTQFKLDDVAKGLLGEGKIDVDHGKFSELTLREMATYCQKDSELTLRLTTYNDNLVMKLLFAVSRTTKASIEDVNRYGVSNWARSMLFFEHRKNRMLIPNKDELKLKTVDKKRLAIYEQYSAGGHNKLQGENKFEGGFVLEPIPGAHFDVTVQDFSSLYPSIIKTHNLSYETINCKHDECNTNNKIPETENWYCTKRQGMLSLIIGVMRDLRVEYFKKLSKDKTLSEDERSLYDAIQQAQKVILNGSYGVVGQEVFQLFCLPVAESVTAFGRNTIKDTKKYAESLGVQIIYGDTDSIFSKGVTLEQINKITDYVYKNFGIDIEVDKKYRYIIFSNRKKNYFGILEDGKVETKGLTAKKSNIPPLVKRCYDECATIFSKVNNKYELDEAIKTVKDLVKDYISNLRKGNYNLKDLAISIKLSREVDSYGSEEESTDLMGNKLTKRKGVPEHIKAVDELQKQGFVINKGDSVSYVKGLRGPMLITKATKSMVDKAKYIDSFKTALRPIFEPLDVDFEEVISDSMKQTTLADMWK